MRAINEFRGVNHVTIHIPDENGKPICSGRREQGNELHGPHEVSVTPEHTDVCPNCRDLVPESERCNDRYVHRGGEQ